MEKYLSIKGYKCFEDKTIQLNQLTVLAGGNSVGKSSVIQSLLLMRSAFERHNQGINKVPLNEDFVLSLGNIGNIISRKYSGTTLHFEYNFNGLCNLDLNTSTIAKDTDLPTLSAVFLKIKDIKFEKDNSLVQPNFHYLHAERLGPRPFHQIGVKERNVGWQGEYSVPILSSDEAKSSAFNVTEKLLFPESEILSLNAQSELWMDYIIPGVILDSRRIDEIGQAIISYNNGSNPYNVGFGISYVLPIVVAGLIAKKGEMLIVENPEAHLHPSGQSRIGQFLARVANTGIQVIIETHSEHVVNGIRLACLTDVIPNNNVVINFFSAADKETQPDVKSISLNENADLEDWPKGFFDQTQNDLATMFRIKRQKNKLK
jgi:predicted ATPase